jgi:hypothetical protein
MMQLLTYYVLPNMLLFGGIYLFGRAAQAAVWYAICNYTEIVK